MKEDDYNVQLSQDEYAFEVQSALFAIQADTYVILQAQAQILAKLNNTNPDDELKKLKTTSSKVQLSLIKAMYKRYGKSTPPDLSDE